MKLNIIIFLFVSLFIIRNSYAQFPNGWIGNWEGDLIAHNQPGDKNQVIKMKLSIQESPKVGVRLWNIWYDDNNGGAWRNYELVGDNPESGVYKMDELNSITLDMFYFNDAFYSMYAVGKALITVRYELKDEKIYFEVTSANIEGERTGGTEDIPEVINYPVRTVQKAVLTKTN
ncbi:MAG: hypothetical protein KDC42_01630 [Ignavibacteriae bacterium]|nr:hypothetical protein [Ignavibacteriota bacterium]